MSDHVCDTGERRLSDRRCVVREFFEKTVPQLLQINGHQASAEGTICFVVHEVGTWKVELGPSPTVDATEDQLQADLLLMFSKSAFVELLAGKAVEPGRGFAADGVLHLLEHFTRLLVLPAKSAMCLLVATRFSGNFSD